MHKQVIYLFVYCWYLGIILNAHPRCEPGECVQIRSANNQITPENKGTHPPTPPPPLINQPRSWPHSNLHLIQRGQRAASGAASAHTIDWQAVCLPGQDFTRAKPLRFFFTLPEDAGQVSHASEFRAQREALGFSCLTNGHLGMQLMGLLSLLLQWRGDPPTPTPRQCIPAYFWPIFETTITAAVGPLDAFQWANLPISDFLKATDFFLHWSPVIWFVASPNHQQFWSAMFIRLKKLSKKCQTVKFQPTKMKRLQIPKPSLWRFPSWKTLQSFLARITCAGNRVTPPGIFLSPTCFLVDGVLIMLGVYTALMTWTHSC